MGGVGVGQLLGDVDLQDAIEGRRKADTGDHLASETRPQGGAEGGVHPASREMGIQTEPGGLRMPAEHQRDLALSCKRLVGLDEQDDMVAVLLASVGERKSVGGDAIPGSHPQCEMERGQAGAQTRRGTDWCSRGSGK